MVHLSPSDRTAYVMVRTPGFRPDPPGCSWAEMPEGVSFVVARSPIGGFTQYVHDYSCNELWNLLAPIGNTSNTDVLVIADYASTVVTIKFQNGVRCVFLHSR